MDLPHLEEYYGLDERVEEVIEKLESHGVVRY